MNRARKMARRLRAFLLPNPAPPFSVDELTALAEIAAESCDAQTALFYACEARRHIPESPRLIDLEAWACGELGQVAKALDLYGRLYNQGTTSAALDAIRLAAAHGDLDHTIHFLLLSLASDPHDTLCEIQETTNRTLTDAHEKRTQATVREALHDPRLKAALLEARRRGETRR